MHHLPLLHGIFVEPKIPVSIGSDMGAGMRYVSDLVKHKWILKPKKVLLDLTNPC